MDDNTISSIVNSMKTTRTAEYPPILLINYSSNPNVVAQVNALRRTYRSPSTIPPDQQTNTHALNQASSQFLAHTINLSETEWLQTIDNAPLDDARADIHTPWRDLVYASFEKVFAATHAYLLHTEGREVTGDFNTPCHEALPISLPTQRGGPSLDMVVKGNVLLLPVWWGRDVRVRIVVGVGAAADTDAEFEEGSKEICWVRGGTRMRVYVDGVGAGEGLAAVMVVGKLS